MTRPKKPRKTISEINYRNFAPLTKVCLQYLILERDELEALRLKDFQNLDQKKAAKKLGVSQPTFHRILIRARKKVSDALINGKEIVIR